MGITGAQDGVDLIGAHEGFAIVDDGIAPPADLAGGPRIGIRVGTDLPWRWSVPGSTYRGGDAPLRHRARMRTIRPASRDRHY